MLERKEPEIGTFQAPKQPKIYNSQLKKSPVFFVPRNLDNRSIGNKEYVKKQKQKKSNASKWLCNGNFRPISSPMTKIAPFYNDESKWKFLAEINSLGAALYRRILGNTHPRAYSVSDEREAHHYYYRMIKFVPNAVELFDFLQDSHTEIIEDSNNIVRFKSLDGKESVKQMVGLSATFLASEFLGDADTHLGNFLIVEEKNRLRVLRIDPECSFINWLIAKDEDYDASLSSILSFPIKAVREYDLIGELDNFNFEKTEIYATLARILSIPIGEYFELIGRYISAEFEDHKQFLMHLLIWKLMEYYNAAIKLPHFKEFYNNFNNTEWVEFFGDKINLQNLVYLKDRLTDILVSSSAKILAKAKKYLDEGSRLLKNGNPHEAENYLIPACEIYSHFYKTEKLTQCKNDYMHAVDLTLFDILIDDKDTKTLKLFVDNNLDQIDRDKEKIAKIINRYINAGFLSSAFNLAVMIESIRFVILILHLNHGFTDEIIYKQSLEKLLIFMLKPSEKTLENFAATISDLIKINEIFSVTICYGLEVFLKDQNKYSESKLINSILSTLHKHIEILPPHCKRSYHLDVYIPKEFKQPLTYQTYEVKQQAKPLPSQGF